MSSDDEAWRWPALLDRRLLGAYMSMAPRTAERLLARHGIRPLQLGLRLRRWRRSDVETLLAGLEGPGAAKPIMEEAEAALQRVALRLSGYAGSPRV